MTTDRLGLERKFEAKQRKKSKPGVVLCASLEQLFEFVEINESIRKLYEACWNKNILLGCILPWKSSSYQKYIPNDGTRELMSDTRQTSCFVIKFGRPSEMIAEKLWQEHQKISFASSANISGQ